MSKKELKMSKKQIFILFSAVLLSLVLSSCAGGARTAQSWPGITPDVARGQVYLAHGQHVFGIDLTNGAEKWRFPQEGDNNITFFAKPALTDDGQLIIGGYDNALYSLNPENGQQNWKLEIAADKYIAGPAVNGERIYAPNSDSNLYTVALDGELLWTFSTEFEQWGTPVIDGNTLYLPAMDHNIYALNAETGDLIWKSVDLGGALPGTPALSEDKQLYIGTLDSEMLAVDASQNGQVSGPLPAEGWIWAGPTLVDDVLYYGDMTGTLYAVGVDPVSPKWKPYKLDSSSSQGFLDLLSKPKLGITGTPLVVADTVYFGSENGVFTALNAESGTKRWDKVFEGRLYPGPVDADGTILVGQVGKNELLYALDYEGSQKWAFIPQE